MPVVPFEGYGTRDEARAISGLPRSAWADIVVETSDRATIKKRQLWATDFCLIEATTMSGWRLGAIQLIPIHVIDVAT